MSRQGLRRKGLYGLLAVVLLLLVAVVLGVGTAVASDTSPSPGQGKLVLRLGWTNDPDNLNPFIGYESSSYEIWALNYELLVGFRSEDMANVPGAGLAQGWEVSEDGKTWTFHITDKAKWQDGKPLTADDVAFTFNYIIDNQMGMFTDYVKFIKHVEATDPTTVVFHCTKPKANMLALWIPILPEHIWSKVDPRDAEQKYRNSPPIIGSGPFQCVEWKKGEYVKMVANKDYWKGAPTVDELIFQTYQNQDTMAQDLKTGALDTAWNIPAAQFTPLDNEPDLQCIAGQLPGFDELGFNCADKKVYPKSTGHPVLTDWRFRQALQWAVDKEKIVSIAYNGFAAPADTIINANYYPANADYHWTPPADQAYTFDLEKAKAALDAAGYKDNDGDGIREYKGKPIRLRLYARSESPESQNAGKLIAGWFRDIGLDIRYQVIDDGALADKQYNTVDGQYAPDFDMFLWGWGGDVDPNFILSVFTTGSIQNWSDCAWSNKEYDKLFLEQQTTIDLQKRVDIIRRMQQIIYKESPYIPLVYPKDLECANVAKWTGWTRSPAKSGLWWYNVMPDTYLNLKPAEQGEQGGGGTNTALIAGIVVAAIVVIIVVVMLMRRGGQREMEA